MEQSGGLAQYEIAGLKVGKMYQATMNPTGQRGQEIVIPFMITSDMHPTGCDKERILVNIHDEDIDIVGFPIQAATDTDINRTRIGKKMRPRLEERDPNNSSKNAAVPSDVTYSIVDSQEIPTLKRLVVRLNKAVSKEILRAIALKLAETDLPKYERVFVFYYLAGTNLETGIPWGTTHFDPDLQVYIFGSAAYEPGSEVIGSWFLKGSIYNTCGGNNIIIYRREGRTYMEERNRIRKASTLEMSENASTDGRFFVLKGFGPISGVNHYRIDRSGDLQFSEEGKLVTAEKIR
jgi:hypothetical protein